MGRQSKPHLASNGYWRCRIDGKQYHLGKNKSAAHRRFHELMAKAGHPEPEADTVDGLIERWLNHNECRDAHIVHWYAFVGSMPLGDVRSDILIEFAEWLRTQRYLPRGLDDKPGNYRPYSPGTIIARVNIAKLTLDPAVRRGRVPPLLRPSLARATRTAKDMTPEQITTALDSLSGPAQADIMRFIIATGCRPGEARKLEWSEIDLTTRTAVIAKHKTGGRTGKARTIFLTDAAVEILMGLPRREGHVFLNRFGHPHSRQGLTNLGTYHGFTPYRLRHSFAQLASEDLPEQDLARLMGHSHQQTTRWYYEVRDSRARAAAQRLSARLAFLNKPATPPKAADGSGASPA